MASTSICIQCAASFFPGPGSKGFYCSTNCTIQHQTLLKREKGAQVRAVHEQNYMKEPSLCVHCSQVLSYKKRKNRFCSSKCAATFNSTGRLRSTESKRKTSEIIKEMIVQGRISTPPKKHGEDHPRWKGKNKIRSLHKCIMCENIIENSNKTCSPACRTARNRQAASENLRKNRHKYTGPNKRSWMERTFVEWLEKHNINKGIYGYWDEVYFKHTVNNKKKNGWADFVFVSRKLIIELDGTHHRTRVDLDAVRDYHLSSKRGYQVVRISHADYIKGTRIAEIKNLLSI